MFLAFLAFWVENTKNAKNAKNRLFFEVRQDFWSGSFLLDRKYFVVYENIKFLVIDARCCSLLVIFSHFTPFSGPIMVKIWCGTNRKWRVTSSNEHQWREMIYYDKIQCISGIQKGFWIKNLFPAKRDVANGEKRQKTRFFRLSPKMRLRTAIFQNRLSPSCGEIFDSNLFCWTNQH